MNRKRYALLAAASGVAFAAVVVLVYTRNGNRPDILQASGHVRGTEITISSKLAGKVENLLIKEGQTVNQGELIARISSEEIAAQVDQAKAQAQASKNRVRQIEANTKELESAIEAARTNVKLAQGESFHTIHEAKAALQRANAEVEAAESQWNLAQKDRERYSALVKRGTVSQREFDVVDARFQAAEAGLRAARQAREEAFAALQKAQVSNLNVNLRKEELQKLLDQREGLRARYALGQNEVDASLARIREIEATYHDSEIRAPARGTITSKLIEQGELVSAGAPIAVLVDLSQIYIRVFISEKDIGKIRLGNPARIYADAFPSQSFEGKVVEVSQRAEFTPRDVQTKEERTKLVFGVKISISNPEGYLKPGMPVDATISWKGDAQQ